MSKKRNKNRISSKPVKKKIEEENKQKKVQKAALKERYVSCLIKGRYFLSVSNALATMIEENEYKGESMGIPRTEETTRAEYVMHKKSAIDLLREVFFTKKALMDEHNVTEKELYEKVKDYYEGKIIRETYEEEDRRPGARRFFS